jgi:hypothetical protein
MKPHITVLLNHTGTEIEVSLDTQLLLSREEIDQLNKVCWDYHWEVEGTFEVKVDTEGFVTWVFFCYVLDHGNYSESYSKEEIEKVKKELVELITKTLPSKSVKCIGFE